MSIINADLVKALDGNAPQYKEEGKEEFGALEGKDGAANSRIVDGNVERVITEINFGGQINPQITDTKVYSSGNIDIREYKSIEIVVRHGVKADNGVAVTIDASPEMERMGLLRYYDWENEEWIFGMTNSGEIASSGHIILPDQHQSYTLLSTHPKFYWLKNIDVARIRLKFKALSAPTNQGNFAAWLVGEKNV